MHPIQLSRAPSKVEPWRTGEQPCCSVSRIWTDGQEGWNGVLGCGQGGPRWGSSGPLRPPRALTLFPNTFIQCSMDCNPARHSGCEIHRQTLVEVLPLTFEGWAHLRGLRVVYPRTQLSYHERPSARWWGAAAAGPSSPSKPTCGCILSCPFLGYGAGTEIPLHSFPVAWVGVWCSIQRHHSATCLQFKRCCLPPNTSWVTKPCSRTMQHSSVDPWNTCRLTLSAASLQHAVHFISACFLYSFLQSQAGEQLRQ